MNYEMRRQKVYEKMEEHSVLILFSEIYPIRFLAHREALPSSARSQSSVRAAVSVLLTGSFSVFGIIITGDPVLFQSRFHSFPGFRSVPKLPPPEQFS